MINLIFGSNLLYIDPAATSMLISSITAIAVGVGASLIIVWRRIRKKMHIKTTDKREVEDEIVLNTNKDNSSNIAGGGDTQEKK